jgi:hypothetical protein
MNETPAELEALAYEHEAQAAELRARAIRRRAAMQAPEPVVQPVGVQPLLDRAQLAKQLGCSVGHVRRLEKQGLSGVSIGDASTMRFVLDDVMAWLRTRPQEPTTPKATPPAVVGEPEDVSDAEIDRLLRNAGKRRRK